MAEIEIFPGSLPRFLPNYCPERAAACLVPLLAAGNVKAAEKWWIAHAGRIDVALRKKRHNAEMRALVLREYSNLTRFYIAATRGSTAASKAKGDGDVA